MSRVLLSLGCRARAAAFGRTLDMRDGHPAAKIATGRQRRGVSRPHRQAFTGGREDAYRRLAGPQALSKKSPKKGFQKPFS